MTESRVAISALAALVVWVATSGAVAQQQLAPGAGPEVRVTVESADVAVNQVFWVEIFVRHTEASQSSSAAAPRGGQVTLAPGTPFELVERLNTQSSFQMNTSGGGPARITREQRMRWQVRATQAGRHQLVVHVDGKAVRDRNALITVAAGSL